MEVYAVLESLTGLCFTRLLGNFGRPACWSSELTLSFASFQSSKPFRMRSGCSPRVSQTLAKEKSASLSLSRNHSSTSRNSLLPQALRAGRYFWKSSTALSSTASMSLSSPSRISFLYTPSRIVSFVGSTKAHPSLIRLWLRINFLCIDSTRFQLLFPSLHVGCSRALVSSVYLFLDGFCEPSCCPFGCGVLGDWL
jgi:hypothetical protein